MAPLGAPDKPAVTNGPNSRDYSPPPDPLGGQIAVDNFIEKHLYGRNAAPTNGTGPTPSSTPTTANSSVRSKTSSSRKKRNSSGGQTKPMKMTDPDEPPEDKVVSNYRSFNEDKPYYPSSTRDAEFEAASLVASDLCKKMNMSNVGATSLLGSPPRQHRWKDKRTRISACLKVEKNVIQSKKAEEVEGYVGSQPVDTLLAFLGESEEKPKEKKGKEKRKDSKEDEKKKKKPKERKSSVGANDAKDVTTADEDAVVVAAERKVIIVGPDGDKLTAKEIEVKAVKISEAPVVVVDKKDEDTKTDVVGNQETAVELNTEGKKLEAHPSSFKTDFYSVAPLAEKADEDPAVIPIPPEEDESFKVVVGKRKKPHKSEEPKKPEEKRFQNPGGRPNVLANRRNTPRRDQHANRKLVNGQVTGRMVNNGLMKTRSDIPSPQKQQIIRSEVFQVSKRPTEDATPNGGKRQLEEVKMSAVLNSAEFPPLLADEGEQKPRALTKIETVEEVQVAAGEEVKIDGEDVKIAGEEVKMDGEVVKVAGEEATSAAEEKASPSPPTVPQPFEDVPKSFEDFLKWLKKPCQEVKPGSDRHWKLHVPKVSSDLLHVTMDRSPTNWNTCLRVRCSRASEGDPEAVEVKPVANAVSYKFRGIEEQPFHNYNEVCNYMMNSWTRMEQTMLAEQFAGQEFKSIKVWGEE